MCVFGIGITSGLYFTTTFDHLVGGTLYLLSRIWKIYDTRSHLGLDSQSALGWYRPSVGVPETLEGTALDPAVYLFNYFQFSSGLDSRQYTGGGANPWANPTDSKAASILYRPCSASIPYASPCKKPMRSVEYE